jgi:hypothetical protein
MKNKNDQIFLKNTKAQKRCNILFDDLVMSLHAPFIFTRLK